MKSNSTIIVFAWCALVYAVPLHGQADYPWLRTGDELYLRGGFADAETAYRKALAEKTKPTTTYNLGNTVYTQNRIPEAIREFEKTVASTTDPQLKSNAYYNLGNAHFQNKAYDESIKAYQESLKLAPGDEDAKRNLTLAMRQLRQQQQQQQQDQQQQENKDQEQPSQDNPQQGDDSDGKDEEQENSASSPEDSSREQTEQTPQDLSEEEAREILKAIEREDQRVQEKLKKTQGKKTPPVKDW